MKSKNIDIYFFSGTGNTFQAVNFFKQKIESINLNGNSDNNSGYTVKLFRIEKTNPGDINLSHTIGIAFPAAYGYTYPFIHNFLSKLPQTNGTDVFLMVTMGGFSGACLTKTKKLLTKKGFNCLSALEIVMPSNLTIDVKRQTKVKPHHAVIISKNEKNKSLLKMPEDIFSKFIIKLIQNKHSWKTNPVLSLFISFGLRYFKPHKYLFKKCPIKVNTSKCIQCGICYNICPSDNIRMYEFPRFENNCEYCLRCYNYCPVKAIEIFNLSIEPYKSADLEELQLGK